MKRILSYSAILLFWLLGVNCEDIHRPPLYTLFLTPNVSGNIGVVTTDFSSSGRFKVLNPELKISYPGLTPIHSDAVGRYYNSKVYIINRLNRDSIQILDPNLAFQTIAEWSMGAGTNPADIEFAGPNKAYVSLYNSRFLKIINPSNGSVLGALDLGGYSEPTSTSGHPDGLPEMSGMKIIGNSLFVCLQRLDRNDASGYWPPSGLSLLLEIDINSDQVVAVYNFPTPNPLGKPQLVNLFGEPHLVIPTPNYIGYISRIDGGIVAFRLSTRTFLSNYLYAETTSGGDLMVVQIANDHLGYASVLDAGFNKTLQVFDPSTGARLSTLLFIPSSFDASLSSIFLASSGILYVANTEFTRPGVSMFDTKNGNSLLTPLPISVDLQPFDLFELIDN
ncbi:hypothetical protein LEP1GSC050_2352 [Leptospira broomii serovar Hurstbridge str. 5399]|uniref:Uncharacterized protein n=1 Tax=Leptospira broomii serovar Hurstbridge str. 5399 TaxID=1049789 RepID=T0FCY6_9LEPT|nr:hypothetical protein [Leptospira broomii]EQA45736.1 hypothetical protein LEP1GSC050_2352 [Leptospira broomii serovar Hurstbridge str. 5399]